MIGPGNSWQMVVADLALILFMVSVSAMDEAQDEQESQAVIGSPLPAQGEPAAIYRLSADAPPIAEWLASEAPDPRMMLTIIRRYREGQADTAAREAAALADRAGREKTRILLEPSDRDETLAVLSYDDPGGTWHDDCLISSESGSDAAEQRNLACEQS